MDRRQFLATVGVTGFAGCLRLQNTDGGGGSPTRAEPTTAAGNARTPTGPEAGDASPTAEPERSGTSTAPDLGPVTGAWNQFAADAANTGYAADESGPTDGIEERWRFDTGNLVISSPVVADGRVVFTGFKRPGHIWAVDTTNGQELWRQELAGVDHIGSPAIDGDRVYVPTWNLGDTQNRLFALNAAGGSFVWQYQLRGGAFGSPTVAGDTVYIGDGPVDGERDGHVAAVATNDGTERWRRSITGVPLGSVAVADGRCYVTSLTPSDFGTYPSNPDWSHSGFPPKRFFVFGNLDEEPYPSITAMDATGYITAIEVDGSSVIWDTELPDFVVSGAAVSGGVVVVGCWDQTVYGLDAGSGQQRWTHSTNGPISSQPSVANGQVFVGSWDGSLYALSLGDGQRRWIYPFGSKVTSSPAVTDERVYVSVDNRGVYGLTTQGRLDFKFEGPIGDYNASSPAIADGALVVCGDIAKRDAGGERGGPFLLA